MATDAELTHFMVRCTRHARNHTAYDRTTHRYHSAYVHPREWLLELEACSQWMELTTPTPPPNLPDAQPEPIDVVVLPKEVTAYEWLVEQQRGTTFTQVGRVRTEVKQAKARACRATIRVPSDGRPRGRFRVTLTVHRAAGSPAVRSRLVEVEEFCIVSMGDSYASGEGNPDTPGKQQIVPGLGDLFDTVIDVVSFDSLGEILLGFVSNMDPDPVWQEPLAHRSYFAGHARAARALEQTHTDSAGVMHVRCATFLSFASSGARIHNLTTTPQHTWQQGSQIQEAKRALGARPVDALLLTIGGNDAGFADTLESLLLDSTSLKGNLLHTLFGKHLFGPFWLLYVALALRLTNNNAEARQRVLAKAREKMGELQRSYRDLAQSLERDVRPREVYLTGYPAGLFDREGGGGGCGIFDLPVVGLEVDAQDAALVRELGQDLNRTISQTVEAINAEARAAGRPARWIFVDGIMEGFAGRGYCASNRLFRRMRESFNRQGDFDGMMHPNVDGHDVYGTRIAVKLQQHCVPQGPSEPPAPAAQIQFSPSSLSFGNVVVGDIRERAITITNTGGVDLQLTIAASATVAPLFWGSRRITLRAGQKATHTISFAPKAAGAHQAILTVTSNAPGSPHRLALSGLGLVRTAPDRPPVLVP
jgi:hypothetical protein